MPPAPARPRARGTRDLDMIAAGVIGLLFVVGRKRKLFMNDREIEEGEMTRMMKAEEEGTYWAMRKANSVAGPRVGCVPES